MELREAAVDREVAPIDILDVNGTRTVLHQAVQLLFAGPQKRLDVFAPADVLFEPVLNLLQTGGALPNFRFNQIGAAQELAKQAHAEHRDGEAGGEQHRGGGIAVGIGAA
jgi:hypothetical protein